MQDEQDLWRSGCQDEDCILTVVILRLNQQKIGEKTGKLIS